MSAYVIYTIATIALMTGIVTISYCVSCYNELITLKNNIGKNWSNIEVLLKQRHDELIKLIDLCKQYIDYEPKTYISIVKAREGIQNAYQKNDVQAFNNEETNLRAGLKSLFALAESYPDLQASKSFQQIADVIHTLETRISERREFFNDGVNLNNTRIEQFPVNVIANVFSFKHVELLQFTSEEKSDVNVAQLFSQ